MFDSAAECFDVPPNIWEILPKLEQTFQNHHQHNILPEMQRVKQFKMVKITNFHILKNDFFPQKILYVI